MLDLRHCRRALVLAPHPDDEAIGCGGLLIRLQELGIATRVVLASDGSGAGELPEGTDAIRQAEFMASLGTLGRDLEAELWRLPDGQLNAHEATLEAHMAAAIDAFDATLLIAPWPGDMHPDHAALGQAALTCHRRCPLAQGVLFFEVWSPLPATHLLDVTAEWPRKQAALGCHATALACGDYAHAMQGLAGYRSLLVPGSICRYAEAYHGLDTGGLAEGVEHASNAAASGIQFRFALPEDGPAIAELFSRIFQTPLTAQWWAWKYAREAFPGSVARSASGDVVGFYGAQARTARWGDDCLPVCQQGDVMVAPGYRFATRREGVFVRLGRHFLERLVGQNRTFALSYGFPTPRALTLGCHLGLYQPGDALQEWHDAVARVCLSPGVRMRLTPAHQVSDWQWLERLSALPAGAESCLRLVRTAGYWASRFGRHPEQAYQLVRLRRWGRICGAAIVRPREDVLEVVDIALRQPHHWPLLLACIHRAAERLGHTQLMAFGTASALAALPGGERRPAGHLALPGPVLDVPLATAVNGHCWMLGGDTDFR